MPYHHHRGGPRLRSREPGHRQASWGELLYDLVYVVIVGQIAHTLVEEQTPGAVGRALVLFVIVWWAWANEVLYSTRLDQDTDRARRLLGTAQLIALVLLAAAIARHHSNDFRVIAAAYAMVRTLQVVELWRGERWVPDARALTEHYTRWHGVAVLLWWVGMPLPTPWCFLLCRPLLTRRDGHSSVAGARATHRTPLLPSWSASTVSAGASLSSTTVAPAATAAAIRCSATSGAT